MDQDERIEASEGVLLAHSALLTALMSVLREKGALTQVDVNNTLDAALIAAEVASGPSPDAAQRARKILELVAQELAGQAPARRS